MEFSQAIHVLDELYTFSQALHVNAQVSFSGGNPMEERHIERLLTIKQPEFYQVSLEGLRDQNDYIRGAGHYRRVLDFLELLRRFSTCCWQSSNDR